MGVWIETHRHMFTAQVGESHPSWVCGLKPIDYFTSVLPRASHPSWVCGLKHLGLPVMIMLSWVTPFVGVWIETGQNMSNDIQRYVTPFVGVWIETADVCPCCYCARVTPFVGVWIETKKTTK